MVGLVYFEEFVQRNPNISGVVAATRSNHGAAPAYLDSYSAKHPVSHPPHRHPPKVAIFLWDVFKAKRDTFKENPHRPSFPAWAIGLRTI